ncbi:putative oxidoreductase [Pelotomaculum sp. FP]|uniref:FAD-binding protein n=1 Tax=Pelotomaculum sp. FP TaxID=261474 RepID=UPI0010665C2A|nr:FAD-binding protein [Pelotomaculum sp. FP]TEB11213.1 putative oxidoreductase [Pelotomaculum sp. FP]
MYDITIIGAGPAGATLARLLGSKYKVLVLDRRELISPREGSFEKCCGGLIAPDAQRMLGKLGLGVPGEVLVGPQLFTVRTIDVQNKMERYYQRHYINIDREKFDSWLVSLIPSTVDIRCGVLFKSYEMDGRKIDISFQFDGKRYTEKTKFLVGADGANSLLRRQLTGSTFQKTYITVQEWFSVKQNQPYYSAIFDNDISDFYSWSIPKDNFLIVGAAITPKENVSRKFDLLKKRMINLGFELNESNKKNGAFLLRPQNAKQIFIGRDNVLLIGEAAGWISPTSAEGLSYAFRSAIALADSIDANSESPISEYHKNTKGLRLNIFQKNLKSPFMYNTLIRKMVMKSGLSSMSIRK